MLAAVVFIACGGGQLASTAGDNQPVISVADSPQAVLDTDPSPSPITEPAPLYQAKLGDPVPDPRLEHRF